MNANNIPCQIYVFSLRCHCVRKWRWRDTTALSHCNIWPVGYSSVLALFPEMCSQTKNFLDNARLGVHLQLTHCNSSLPFWNESHFSWSLIELIVIAFDECTQEKASPTVAFNWLCNFKVWKTYLKKSSWWTLEVLVHFVCIQLLSKECWRAMICSFLADNSTSKSVALCRFIYLSQTDGRMAMFQFERFSRPSSALHSVFLGVEWMMHLFYLFACQSTARFITLITAK